MLDSKHSETTIMDNLTPPIVEFGGSGEEINLEFSSKLSPDELKNIWKSSLPRSATQIKEKQLSDHLAISFTLCMSSELNDFTTVNISFEKQNENLTQIKLTHSYLIDENECNDMKKFWNEFSQKIGQT